MATVDVVISVSDAYLDKIPTVVAMLEAAGLGDIQSFDAVGIITGSLDEANLAGLALIEGVAGVQRSQEYRLPPQTKGEDGCLV
jgi:hypothetical protein